jgi:outer membrane protein TolC
MLRTAVVLLLLQGSGLAWPQVAASQDATPITLDDAIARASKESQRIAELQARVDAASAAEAGRKAADRPFVSVQGGYQRTNHVDEFSVPSPGLGLVVVYPDIPDNYRSRIDLQWPIYSGGRTDALERAARAERTASGEDLAAARADLRLETTRAFFALVTADDSERVLAGTLQSIEAHVRDLRARLEQGLIPPNDVLSAEAQRSRQRLLAIEAHNLRGIAEADLRRLTGIATPGTLEPKFAAAGPATPGDLAALLALARESRPERRAFAERAAAGRAREDAASAAGRPQLAVNAGYDYARPNPRIFPRVEDWKQSWDASVNLSWALWDGGRRKADEAEAAAGTRALEARALDFDRQLEFEVRQRWLEAASTQAAIEAADDGVRAAVEARRVVMERFNAGVATSTDVLDAETAVLQAELDQTRSVANARMAVARLDRAVGR